MLGIDIGTSRLRVAYARASHPDVVEAVASRDLPAGAVIAGIVVEPELVGALIDEAVAELGSKDRRCVSAVGRPIATMRLARFPARMTAFERNRAARLETQRRLGTAAKDTVVRVHPLPENAELFAVGTASDRALTSRTAALRGAALRVMAIDYDGIALRRSFPGADGVLDVGFSQTSLHVVSESVTSLQCDRGGRELTEAIAQELGLDARSAESRKRTVGTAGAGEGAREALVREVAALVEAARRRRCVIESIAMVGNGSRLDGLRDDIERAANVRIALKPPHALARRAFPEDVARAASADWALAVGLAVWGHA